MENQLLKIVGNRLPKCQGGAAELSTMVLGDGDELVNCPTQPTCDLPGHSNGFSDGGHVSPMLRLTLDGRLVGQRLDRTGLTGMRFGTRWFKEAANQTSPAQVEETDLGVDFCLTWDSDPRLILLFLSCVQKCFPCLFMIAAT